MSGEYGFEDAKQAQHGMAVKNLLLPCPGMAGGPK